MNNIFDIKRFGKVLSKELKEYFPKYGSFELALLAGYVLYFVIRAFLGVAPALPDDRIKVVLILMWLCSFIAPFKLYGDTNNDKLGITYAMLPASSLEKYVSMLIYSVVFTTIGFAVSIFCLDAALSIIPVKTGFSGTLFTPEIFSGDNIKLYFSLMLMQSLPFLGNLYFKKHKISNTILWSIALNFAVSIVMAICIKLFGFNNFGMSDGVVTLNGMPIEDENFAENIKTWLKVLFYIYVIGVPVVFYVLSYFRLKTQKY